MLAKSGVPIRDRDHIEGHDGGVIDLLEDSGSRHTADTMGFQRRIPRREHLVLKDSVQGQRRCSGTAEAVRLI